MYQTILINVVDVCYYKHESPILHCTVLNDDVKYLELSFGGIKLVYSCIVCYTLSCVVVTCARTSRCARTESPLVIMSRCARTESPLVIMSRCARTESPLVIMSRCARTESPLVIMSRCARTESPLVIMYP